MGIPIPLYGIPAFKRLARIMLPIVSYFPMSMLFYGSGGAEQKPKYGKYFAGSDLIAGNFLFMRKYMPERMDSKVVVTNTTTEENIELFKARGVNRYHDYAALRGSFLWHEHDGSRTNRLCREGEKAER